MLRIALLSTLIVLVTFPARADCKNKPAMPDRSAQANPNQTSHQEYTVKIEGPYDFITQSDLNDIRLYNHDSTLPFMRLGENEYWVYLSEGGKDDGKHSSIHRLKTDGVTVDKSTVEDVPVSGIPDANVNQYNGWKAWMMNLYEIDSDEWLAVMHYEDQDVKFNEDFRMGLAYSQDDGKSFKHLGFVLSTEIPSSDIKNGLLTNGKYNIAGGGFRWDGTYMYIYFNDYAKLDRSDRHGAVARAKIADVVENARKGENTNWFKYYNGKWAEPGLGGRSSDIGIEKNPSADLWTQWIVPGNHSMLMYNTYIGKWITFSMKNDVLTMCSTSDPLDFNVPYEIISKLPKGCAAAYFTIMPHQQDMNRCGKEFFVYYRYWYGGKDEYHTARLKLSLEKSE